MSKAIQCTLITCPNFVQVRCIGGLSLKLKIQNAIKKNSTEPQNDVKFKRNIIEDGGKRVT